MWNLQWIKYPLDMRVFRATYSFICFIRRLQNFEINCDLCAHRSLHGIDFKLELKNWKTIFFVSLSSFDQN